MTHIRQRPASIPATIIMLALLGVSNAYASFPRNDGETRSAGFNVSQNDFVAVASIHDKYTMGTYVVLGNQSLSAAALSSYGFTQYFPDDIFYYPIPTGGPLYEIFLDMASTDASRDTAKKAHTLTQAPYVLFVSHAYWTGADATREQAKKEADAWYSIGIQNEIMIFLYDFSDQQ